MPQRPLGPVGHNRPKHGEVVGGDLHPRAGREARTEPPLDRLQTFRAAGEDRPQGRKSELALREESVGVRERAQDRGKVGTRDAHIVQHDDGRTGLPSKTTQKTRQDLGDREPSAVEAVVEPLQERGRDPVRPTKERGAQR